MAQKALYVHNGRNHNSQSSYIILQSNKDFLSKENKKLNNDFNYKINKKDFKLIKFLINFFFLYLVARIKKYHKRNYNDKFWKILLFPFLDYIIPQLYLRWKHIGIINKNYFAHIYKYKSSKFIPKSFEDFNLANNLDFNKWILSEIIEYQNKLKFKKKIVNIKKIQEKKNSFFKKILIFFFKIIFTNKKYNFLIKGIGLSKLQSILFYFKIKQIPIFLINEDFKSNKINLKKRKLYFSSYEKKKNFINFIKKFLIFLIPKNYLENFEDIDNLVKNSYWPNNVRAVIVGHDYYFNDFFKFWMSNQSLTGTKLYIMQHGGRMGTEKFITNEYVQRSISDLFLTWGWNDRNDQKVHPFFCLNFSNKNNDKKIPGASYIYFCQNIYPNYYSHIDGQPISFLKKKKLIQYANQTYHGLNCNIKKYFIVRYLEHLSKLSVYHPSLINKQIIHDKGLKKLSKIVDGRIFIHDQDSTAFLETLAYNVPTILIFNDYSKIKKEVVTHYKALENCGIIQNNIENLCNFINENYTNIYSWWFSKKVQNARNIFIKRYVKISKNSVSSIIRFLYKNEKKNRIQ
jgi:putative transferase (TIGR04331 family)